MGEKDYRSAFDPQMGHPLRIRPQELRFRTRTSTSYGLLLSLTLFLLLSFSSISAVPADEPRILYANGSDTDSTFVTNIGESVELLCEIKDGAESMIWQKESADELKWDAVDICENKNKAASSKSKCYVQEKLENNTTILKLVINGIRQPDFGKYSCGVPITGGSNAVKMKNAVISVEARVKIVRRFEKGQNSTIVLEGDSVDIFCNLTRPEGAYRYQVGWWFNGSYHFVNNNTKNERIERFTYTETNDFTNIRISPVSVSDKGWYQCSLWDSSAGSDVSNSTIVVKFDIRLRVKDKMLSLYPFISICVEVVIIFLIILIYEKSKSKTEVEESDTDGSPDQKNVSDNGEAEGMSEATRLAKE